MRKRRLLTLEEHERLGEMLFQAERMLFDAWKIAAQAYTVADLKPLERLWQSTGTLDKIKSRLDSKLYREHLYGPEHNTTRLARVYFGVEKRLKDHEGTPHA